MPSGEVYSIDTGANITVHKPPAQLTGNQRCFTLADGTHRTQPEVVKNDVIGVEGPRNLIGTKDLPKLLGLGELIDEKDKDPCNRYIPRPFVGWLKEYDVKAQMDKAIEDSMLNSNTLRQILEKGKCAKFKNDVGLAKDFNYIIRGGNPESEKQYPLQPEVAKEMAKTISELEQLGVISKQNELTCLLPIQAVPKKDETDRPVHNLKGLNRVTIKDKRVLLNPKNTLQTMEIKKYKTCLDIANGFWSCPIDPMSREKTGITHRNQGYVWNRFPQGFVNSPNAFQWYIEKVLEGLPVLVYVDDVYFTHDEEKEHLEVLEKVIVRLKEAGLKIGLHKCSFGQESVKYLGFQIGLTEKEISEGYVENIGEPTTIVELEKGIGKLVYVQSHVLHMAEWLQPLHNIKKGLRKRDARGKMLTFDRKLTSEEKQLWKDQLELIKKNVQKLSPVTMSEKVVLSTQLTDKGGSVILKNERNQPYAIVSMVWSPTEQRYPLVEKELCLLLRSYKSMKRVGDPQEVAVLTEQPIVKELSKGTVEGTKAYLSRWGKWQMLLSDPSWVFEARFKKPKEKEPVVEPDFVPTITLYTDGSKKKTRKIMQYGGI